MLTTLQDLDCRNKRVIIREDLNVPMEKGTIRSDARIRAALPTIQYALKQQAAVILLSHLGRPEEGSANPDFSLAPIAARLQVLLGRSVKFIRNWLEGFEISPGEVVVCENVRLQKGERKNDLLLAKKIARLGDIFVMDAFATAHRSEASTVGVAQFSAQVCAGLLLAEEVNALTRALKNPARPLLAIVGGSKISSKLPVLSYLITQADSLILGGGIANTFLAAQQYGLGKSLVENSFITQAKDLMVFAQQKNTEILLPKDVVVANEITATAKTKIRQLTEIQPYEMILDSGPVSERCYKRVIQSAATILWNGPIGVFEMAPFEQGTRALSSAIANSCAFTVAGGGDTLAVLEKYKLNDKISYVSTGGGAFLEFIEGKALPALMALEKRKYESEKL